MLETSSCVKILQVAALCREGCTLEKKKKLAGVQEE